MTKFKVFKQDGQLGEKELITEDISAAAAKKLVFALAKKHSSYHEGDWQYCFESNNSSIYFHSNDKRGIKKELVGRIGDEKIELLDCSFWMEAY